MKYKQGIYIRAHYSLQDGTHCVLDVLKTKKAHIVRLSIGSVSHNVLVEVINGLYKVVLMLRVHLGTLKNQSIMP